LKPGAQEAAWQELRELAADPSSGVTVRGRLP
jgi:hypothetical protein